MSKKRLKWTESTLTLEKAFGDFVIAQLAKGVAEKNGAVLSLTLQSLGKTHR